METAVPAMTVVNLIDADGDEFPVALQTPPLYSYSDQTLETAARDKIAPMIEAGDLRPTLPLTVGKIERP